MATMTTIIATMMTDDDRVTPKMLLMALFGSEPGNPIPANNRACNLNPRQPLSAFALLDGPKLISFLNEEHEQTFTTPVTF